MANFWSVPRGTNTSNRRTHGTRVPASGYPGTRVRTRVPGYVPGTRVLGRETSAPGFLSLTEDQIDSLRVTVDSRKANR
eukprot:1934611-Rhodomonas_salina.1